MTWEDALSVDDKRTILNVHVIPNSKKYHIQYDHYRKELKIKVKAHPERGKANLDLIKFLSTYFEAPEILSGHTKRSKRIAVNNTREEVVSILQEIIS